MGDQHVLATATPAVSAPKDPASTPKPAAPRVVPALPQPPAAARKWLMLAVAVVAVAVGYFVWRYFQPAPLPAGFASSNGRIEATEVNVATKTAGRVVKILVDEGDYVKAGDVVAYIDTDSLNAQLRESQANLAMAKTSVETAKSTVKQRESEKLSAMATVKQREADYDVADKNFVRAEKLKKQDGISQQEYDDIKSKYFGADATLKAAQANVAAAEASLKAAETMVVLAGSTVEAAKAKVDRLHVDIDECTLRAPRDGRVQYRVAQPGEVLAAGGRVVNMIDLTDVYMTFFLSTGSAGRVKKDAEARIVLDAAPEWVIPAKVTFVADVAQFTPKTVETAEERQKLTFRLKAHIPPELLRQHLEYVKTGLPGMAYVQLEPPTPWPSRFDVKLPSK